MTLSKDTLYAEVPNLLRRIYDLTYLRTHPLAQLLTENPHAEGSKTGWELHHLLMGAIEALNPGADAPVSSLTWRRYHVARSRFADCRTPEQVADELSISRRQLFREQKTAIEAIVDVLWERYVVRKQQLQDDVQPVQDQATLGHLELLRLETARLSKANQSASVDHVIHDLLPLIQTIMEARQLTAITQIPKTVPPVAVNRSLLRNILLGMLSCVVEFTEHTQVTLSVQPTSESVIVSVAAQAADLDQQADSVEVKRHLESLRQMVTMSGGQLQTLRGEKGSLAVITHIPIARRTVLIIEDNNDVVELYRRYLGLLGYQILSAKTASEALRMAQATQPYAITLDLMMPDQDGWDLLQKLCHSPSTQHIPVVVCTVLDQKALALSLGATAFLRKPVAREALASVLDTLSAL